MYSVGVCVGLYGARVCICLSGLEAILEYGIARSMNLSIFVAGWSIYRNERTEYILACSVTIVASQCARARNVREAYFGFVHIIRHTNLLSTKLLLLFVSGYV